VPKQPPKADPHASRDGIVHEAIARLSAGDAEGFLALAPTAAQMQSAVSCDEGSRMKDLMDEVVRETSDKLRESAQKAKGRFEVVAIESRRVKEEGKAGEREEKCTLKVDVATHKLEVKLKADNGSPRTIRLDVLALGPRFYLTKSSSIGGGGNLVEKFAEHTEKMCACKDMACATKVNDEFSKAMAEFAKETVEAPPDEAVTKQLTALAQKLAECQMKLSPPSP
jgi:hypothetical protein